MIAAAIPAQARIVVVVVMALLGERASSDVDASEAFGRYLGSWVAGAYVHGENKIRNIQNVQRALQNAGVTHLHNIGHLRAVREMVETIAADIDEMQAAAEAAAEARGESVSDWDCNATPVVASAF